LFRYTGVTLIVAIIGLVVVLIAVKEGILPDPLAANPIPGWLFVQVYWVPDPTKAMAEVKALWHTTTAFGAVTLGVGFTVIVNDVLEPLQEIPPPVNTEVTATVPDMGADPPFAAIKEAISPLPEAANPIFVLELVQTKEVPVPVNETKALFDPLHKVRLLTGLGWVFGFTVIVNTVGLPVHVTPFIVKEADTDTDEVRVALALEFVAINTGMLPEPLAPKPMAVFALVHAKVAPATGLVKITALDDAL
jgi:hypothetical protein